MENGKAQEGKREGTSSAGSGICFRLEGNKLLSHCNKRNGRKDEWVYVFLIYLLCNKLPQT